MSAPSSISRRRTFCPPGPVWWVSSCIPRIFFERLLTSSMLFATLTPPPLPRPPAWICALTTQTLPPSFFAASTASSTLKAGKPRGVGSPNLRKISLPWYSWIFIPPWVPLLDGVAGGFERVALVELERLAAVGALLGHLTREALDRGSWQAAEHFREVRAAFHVAEKLLHTLAEGLREIQADQALVGRRDRFAAAGIRHRIGARDRVEDVEVAVDRDPQPHLVDRLPGAAHAGLHRVVVALDVGEMRLDVPEPVGALVALVAHAACVPQLALDVGDRQWHGRGFYRKKHERP